MVFKILRLIFSTSMKHRCLPPCVLQRGRHYQIEGVINFHSKIFWWLFGLEVWLFGGWADTSFGLCSSSAKKYPARKLELLSFQNLHRSPRWYIKNKGHLAVEVGAKSPFFKYQLKIFFLAKLNCWKTFLLYNTTTEPDKKKKTLGVELIHSSCIVMVKPFWF